MTAPKRRTTTPAKNAPRASQGDPEVDAFLRRLDHPLKSALEEVRTIILGVSPTIGEGIKWNAPSFRTDDYFATLGLRKRDTIELVFHRGAKVRDNSTTMKIKDPLGMVRWLATDRALVTIGDGSDVAAKRAAFESIVREWIAQL